MICLGGFNVGIEQRALVQHSMRNALTNSHLFDVFPGHLLYDFCDYARVVCITPEITEISFASH